MEDWKEYHTSEGVPYYVNKKTGDIAWDIPAETTNVGADTKELLLWIPHPIQGWIIGSIVNLYSRERALVRDAVTKQEFEVTFPPNPVKIESLSALKKTTDDLVRLELLDDPTILHNLRERAKNAEIYTNVGDILISINPYKVLPLYTPAVMEKYWREDTSKLPPHVFTIADTCYRQGLVGGKKMDQSIIISGESGAGKTEATKLVLQYLAEFVGSNNNSEQNMLLSNPIMEAFGNAKTVRNNNSSRFGKWMEIHFDKHTKICGCKIQNYLLEKSRVVYLAPNERNYHFFYQLCAGASADLKKTLHLEKGASSFHYLNSSGCMQVQGIDDAQQFTETLEALSKLNFPKNLQEEIIRVVAGILHLGNIEFKRTGDNDEKSEIIDSKPLELAAEFMQLSTEVLKLELIQRKFNARAGSFYMVPLTVEEAVSARDSLAKHIYGRLFDWLVKKINEFLSVGIQDGTKTTYIGVLDIFGFEIFEQNSFEQLCINYTNEKLQQHFNQHTFKLEEEVYQREQIKFEHIDFIDNQACLDLIEETPGGIFSVMDEELVLPKSTDDTFLQKLHTNHSKKSRYRKPVKSAVTFTIVHYAGDVNYEVTGWLDKNKDTLYEGLLNVMEGSHSPLVNEVFPQQAPTDLRSSGEDARRLMRRDSVTLKKSNKLTLAAQFKRQLTALMVQLHATTPHYIRCIKPNETKTPVTDLFCGDMVLKQLTYSGVLEAVEIRQTGYPFRLSHQDFYHRYKLISPKNRKKKPSGNLKNDCKAILADIPHNLSTVQVGNSMVLYRAPQHRLLELLRNDELRKLMIRVQAVYRAHRARVIFKKFSLLRKQLRDAIRANVKEQLEAAVGASDKEKFQVKEYMDAKKAIKRIEQEKQLAADLIAALALFPIDKVNFSVEPPPEHWHQLEDIITRCRDLDYNSPDTKAAGHIYDEIKKRMVVKAEILANIQAGIDGMDTTILSAAVKRAEEVGLDLPEVDTARKEINLIDTEKSIIQTLARVLSVTPDGDVSLQSQFLNEHVKINTDPNHIGELTFDEEAHNELFQAVQQAMEFGLRSEEGQLLFKTASFIWNLRFFVTENDWEKAEDLLIHKDKDGKVLETPESKAVREQLMLRAEKNEVLEQLRLSAEVFDPIALCLALDKALKLELADIGYYMQLLDKIMVAQDKLGIGFQNKDIAMMSEGIIVADSIGYTLTDYQVALQLRNTLVELEGELSTHLKYLMDREKLEELHHRCQELEYVTEKTKKLEELLVLNDISFMKEQLKAAIKNADHERKLELSIKMKEHYFSQFKGQFQWTTYVKLRSAEDFAKVRIFGRDEIKKSMWTWTKIPIPTSLTNITNHEHIRVACACFKNIMGYMGDKPLSYPEGLATEVIHICSAVSALRDEIFIQIMKQLTENPSPESERKGWQLLKLCIQGFPPSSEFENYLEIFLLEHNKLDLRKLMYERS